MSPSPADDERTVINSAIPSSAPTPIAPPNSAAPDSAWHDGHTLPLGTRLGEFELTEKIGEGGFSIVYLAMDHSLERKVAVKEYMPTSIATRSEGTHVNPRSERQRETFEAGLRSFINEAKLLAQFDHRSLVKVYRFWEANGTAYMVMPFYLGVTVRDHVRAMPDPPDEAWLRALLAPLTDALLVIHAEHCFHRDIAPDNVMLLAGTGAPLLLDFGAARRVIGDMTHALTVILKPGYAPIEQYAEIPGMQQGAWTDVYALAAVVYWIITGKTPPASAARLVQDAYVPLVECAAGRYSLPFLQAIDRALIVLPAHRTQNIGALRLELGLGATMSVEPSAAAPAANDVTVVQPPVPVSGAKPRTQVPPTAPPAREIAGDGAKPRRTHAILAGTSVAALAIAAGVWWSFQTPAVPAVAPQPQNAASTPAATMPSGTPVEVNTPEAPPPAQPASPAPEPAPIPAPAVDSTPPALPPMAQTHRPVATTDNAPAPAAAHAGHKPPRTTNADTPKAAQNRIEPNANAAECARIMQRLSLGESNPALLERVKALNCR